MVDILKPSGEERLLATLTSGTPPPAAGTMSGPYTAFFYGTLMAPEVFFSVVYGRMNPGKVYEDLHTFHPAIVDGYVRFRVKGADYPGIIAREGESVRGVYATGLTEANVQKLDHFEGVEYVKEEVNVRLADTGEEKAAPVYVYQHPAELEDQEWDFEHFKREKLALWSRSSV
ncbi:related to disease resistance protein aig2 [Cephalotrichum gorgonifer]|uniref:Putative gamma-glutamylcyclotransferase n=1 Tax=Cephalotrichum gorgonifer TaxID=2041049 RepID=A0AAE8SR57_9PEZI|nr:related to disease resistance protein aig2 [Cephalotrichum gorgonifer]